MDAIYLDNAATSFPKPEGVSDRMKYYLDCVGANVNRSVYTAAQEAGLVTLSLRQRLSELFRFPESPSHVILTPGATASLNMLVAGLLRPGDHCIVSSMEHNAVMRPLLRLPGVEVSRIPCDREGFAEVDALEGLFRENTRLVLIAHGSNVSGTVQDAETIGRICAARGVPFALDGAQTAGHFPVDFQAMHLSALAVPGHKGLLGPGGIGALLVTDELARRMTPLIAGGTGSASDSEYLPDYLPDKFESGTANLPGCYGWEAAVRFVAERGVDSLRQHEMRLCQRFIEGLEEIPHVHLCGTRDMARRVGVLSVDLLRRDNAEAAFALESRYGILTRCGLHCAPSAHRTLGTFPHGTVRFSLGWANTEADVDAAVAAIRELA